MSNHTSRETRTNFPTFGGPFVSNSSATTGRTGLAWDSSGNPKLLNDAGTPVIDFVSTAQSGVYKIRLAVTGASGSSGVFASIVNPWGEAMIITKAVLDLTTVATGAATVDIGVAATAIANDTLMDGLDVNAATGLFDNVTNKGTNGLPQVVWAATGYVTVAEASGDVNGMVGVLNLTCYKR